MIALSTPRLTLREFLTHDAAELYLLNKDPEVLRYTGDLPYRNIGEALTFINSYDQYAKYKTGRLAMILKNTHAFVGWCGLKYHPETGETDLGFRLKKEFWNRGLATEASIACIDYGFKVLKLEAIVGRALKANSASVKVLKKVGMKFSRDFDFEGEPGVLFILENKAE